jgi:HSP20 family protein
MNLVTFEPEPILDHFFHTNPFYDFPKTSRRHKNMQEWPKVNVIENDRAFVIEAETPGITEKDVSIEVHNGVLTLKSEHEETTVEKKDGYHIREFSRNRFERCFNLSDQIDPENITAKMEQGILKMTLPKVEKEKPKKIQIKLDS